jgi:hypothetical protein
MTVDAAPEWRLCCAGSVYRSVLSQAGIPIKDAAMSKIVAGLAIWLGGVAEFPVGCRFRHRDQRAERASHA